MSDNILDIEREVTPDTPLVTSCQGIIADLLKKNDDPENLKEFASTPFDDLIVYHHTLGRRIRNTYGLWVNEGLCVLCQAGDDKVVHPDDASQYIIEQMWSQLQ